MRACPMIASLGTVEEKTMQGNWVLPREILDVELEDGTTQKQVHRKAPELCPTDRAHLNIKPKAYTYPRYEGPARDYLTLVGRDPSWRPPSLEYQEAPEPIATSEAIEEESEIQRMRSTIDKLVDVVAQMRREKDAESGPRSE